MDETVVNGDSANLVFECQKNKENLKKFKTVIEDVMEARIDWRSSYDTIAKYDITRENLKCSSQKIKSNITSGIKDIIVGLLKGKNDIYIMSGGIKQNVDAVCNFLGVDKNNCFGAELSFDKNSVATHFIESDCLYLDGKAKIIKKLKSQNKIHGKVIMIGDGINDLAVFKEKQADVFIGFGMNRVSKKVKEEARIFAKELQFLATHFFIMPKID